MIPPVRVPGAPEHYRGKYQATSTSLRFEAACPACGRDCQWVASVTTGTAPACGCPTSTDPT